MALAKNDETVSTFVKVMQKKLWPLFFPDTVYIRNDNKSIYDMKAFYKYKIKVKKESKSKTD